MHKVYGTERQPCTEYKVLKGNRALKWLFYVGCVGYGAPADFVAYQNEENQLSSHLSAPSRDAASINQRNQDLSQSAEGKRRSK